MLDMPTPIKQSYCCECSWTASTEKHTRQELTALMIEHAVETGHDIDSTLIDTELAPPSRPQLN